ncbi:Cytochrome c2 [compost metagenome]
MSFHKSLKAAAGALLLALAAQSGLALADGCPAAEAEQGQNVFARDCAACHSAGPNQPGMMGPNLHGVLGRKAGSLAGFPYSEAMKTKGADWSRDNLDAFIEQPQGTVPGTYMPFAGLADAAERKAVTCWLSQQR